MSCTSHHAVVVKNVEGHVVDRCCALSAELDVSSPLVVHKVLQKWAQDVPFVLWVGVMMV